MIVSVTFFSPELYLAAFAKMLINARFKLKRFPLKNINFVVLIILKSTFALFITDFASTDSSLKNSDKCICSP